MNKEDVINGIKERLFNNCELRPSEVLVLKDYIKQLETNIDEVIKEIKYFELQADHLDDSIYLDKTLSNKLLSLLERGKE